MAHHGDDLHIYQEQFSKALEQSKLIQDEANRIGLGATGKFPQGHLNEDDEGEIRVGITTDKDKVVIAFGKEVSWIGFTKEQAMEIGNLLHEQAHTLS